MRCPAAWFPVALLLALAPACSTSRAGWGKGAWRELHEAGELQVRRAPVRVDEGTGELVLAWIGARVPEGVAGVLDGCELLVYRDDDVDRVADAGEIVLARSSAQPGRKIQFDDLRVRPAETDADLVAQLEVRTKAGRQFFRFLFRHDE
ncbi:MAG: hypothetical protein IPJ77_24680 [Planctomycetes bacterium]|nr:hypothetical protein [Planctomycetota bacterium]